MALEVLADIAKNLPTSTPIVFASRHGEALRSFGLIRELHTEGSVSPQSFSLSVHNATAGIHTIALGCHANVTALAGSQATGDALLTEAMGLLLDGAQSVLVVACDEPLPDCYRPYLDEPQAPFAWAAELIAGDQFMWRDTPSHPCTHALPELLATFLFLIDTQHNRPAPRHWQHKQAELSC